MSRLWMIPSLVVALLVLGAPLLALLGVLGPGASFRLFTAGVGIGLLSTLVLAGAAALGAALGRPWRSSAVRAAAIPLVLTLGVILPNFQSARNHPIHDITTDPQDTLQFTPDVASYRAEAPREQVLEQQRALYPDLAPLVVVRPPDQVYERAIQVAQDLDWEIVARDPAAGRIEATATSTIFRFVDDVVIRVQREGSGSRVDVRSRSRVGQSDLGANAGRIRAFLSALEGATS